MRKVNRDNFDFGLELCRLREYANGVKSLFYTYEQDHGIDFIKEPDNEFVKAEKELYRIAREVADKCETADDIDALYERIEELRMMEFNAREEEEPGYNVRIKRERHTATAEAILNRYLKYMADHNIDPEEKGNRYAEDSKKLSGIINKDIPECEDDDEFHAIYGKLAEMMSFIGYC